MCVCVCMYVYARFEQATVSTPSLSERSGKAIP